MTDPQIQIAVAKACGWTCTLNEDGGFMRFFNDKTKEVRFWPVSPRIPNYLHSHDAMAEALGTMTEADWDYYVAFLGSETATIYAKGMLRATPRQQAVAFLKATNNHTT